MNILFLDIDGVLNACDGSGLNTDKVTLLKEICDATDCRIVLSSSWRLNERQFLRVVALCKSIGTAMIGATADLTTPAGILFQGVERWREISEWISDSGTYGNDEFVILDDEKAMGPLSHIHVRTDSHTGLTPELAREVIRRFNG